LHRNGALFVCGRGLPPGTAGNKKAAGAAFNVASQRPEGLPPGTAGNKKGAEAPF